MMAVFHQWSHQRKVDRICKRSTKILISSLVLKSSRCKPYSKSPGTKLEMIQKLSIKDVAQQLTKDLVKWMVLIQFICRNLSSGNQISTVREPHQLRDPSVTHCDSTKMIQVSWLWTRLWTVSGLGRAPLAMSHSWCKTTYRRSSRITCNIALICLLSTRTF